MKGSRFRQDVCECGDRVEWSVGDDEFLTRSFLLQGKSVCFSERIAKAEKDEKWLLTDQRSMPPSAL